MYTGMKKKYRSVVAQLRSGILPLEIETGRWKGTELDHRLCQLCRSGCVEDKAHFLFNYEFYKSDRLSFAQETSVSISNLSLDKNSLTSMQENNILAFAKYVWKIYEKRKGRLFGNSIASI